MGERDGAEAPRLSGLRFHRRLEATDFSEIWLVEDLALQRPLAAKIFAPRPDANGMIEPFPVEEWRRRFLQEARLMAGLDHPHILPVVSLAYLEDGRPCMLQQYMAGSLRHEIGLDVFKPDEAAALAERDRPRAVKPARAKTVLLELLSALVAVHERGIVHRDVKPRNLLLAKGPGSRAKLADFGMARPPGEAEPDRPVWIGTRDYIAPEQYANAGQATDRSDIFSVGVVGIRMLTGHFPDRERLARVKGLPPPFADLLVEALSRLPDQRPSARAMLSRLAAI